MVNPLAALFPMKQRVLSLYQDCARSFWKRTSPHLYSLMDRHPHRFQHFMFATHSQASKIVCLLISILFVICSILLVFHRSASNLLSSPPPPPRLPPNCYVALRNENHQDLLLPAFQIFEQPLCVGGLFDSVILICVEINRSF